MLEDSDSGDLDDIDVIPNEEMLMVCCILKRRKFLNIGNLCLFCDFRFLDDFRQSAKRVT